MGIKAGRIGRKKYYKDLFFITKKRELIISRNLKKRKTQIFEGDSE
jgi:hypothetical protein